MNRATRALLATKMKRLRRILPLAGVLAVVAAPAAMATHPLPPLDNSKVAYDPVGHIKAGDPIPADFGKSCETVTPLLKDGVFNPSGKFSAHDTSVYEVFCLPYRDQGDTSASDPLGNGGEPRHGYCAGAPPVGDPTSGGDTGSGTCPNHQLEYINFFQKQMETILGDFGVTFEVYEYMQSETDCPAAPCIGRLPAAIVAGGDHPEQHILIGSHFDQTTSGPASVWDSQEGHAEMIRVAKIMADYWKSTGTRPAATVKFVPMDGEEDGLLGSVEYVNNVIPPEGEKDVRGYFNADPCAGGYPAFHYGGANRIDLGIQLGISEEPDVNAFNEKAPAMVEGIFDRIDDKLENRAGYELFVSTAEGLPGVGGDIGRDVFIGFESPLLFGSDWQNFIGVGIPIFNPTPKVTGPQSGGDTGPQSVSNPPEGLYQFHTPLDNWQTMSRYSGQDPAGQQFSEAYIKGMEFCASMLAEAMLQPEMGGAQKVDTKPVAFYTALPNEATVGNFVNFRGGASHQLKAGGGLVPKDELQLKWEFGDGTPTAFGENVKHAYKRAGTYTSKLTVTNRSTNETASMSLPIVVEEGAGTDSDPSGQFADIARAVPKKDAVVACQSNYAFSTVSVKPSGKGLQFNFAKTANKPVSVEVFQATKGKTKRITKFSGKTASFKWKGKKRLKKGTYFVRITGQNSNNQLDDRFFPLTFSKKFRKTKAFTRKGSCQLVSLFRLSAPAFGKALQIGVATTEAADVEVRVLRGKKTVKRFTAKATANRASSFTLSGKKLKKGVYKIVLKASGGGQSKTDTLYARKL
jgi:PKD repeat protein